MKVGGNKSEVLDGLGRGKSHQPLMVIDRRSKWSQVHQNQVEPGATRPAVATEAIGRHTFTAFTFPRRVRAALFRSLISVGVCAGR